MPKQVIDYSNTIIYKLCCKDPTIKDIYIGHTTNFVKRKQQHKNYCNAINDKHYNYNVYQFIREHGNWDNWSMIEICSINCVDKRDAEKQERHYIETLMATLNKNIPIRTKQEYYEDNKEEISLKNKKYREEHKEEISLKKQKYREEHKEEYSEYYKNYYEDNKEYILLRTTKYREEQREQIRLRDKKYRENNREKINAQQNERRRKKLVYNDTTTEGVDICL